MSDYSLSVSGFRRLIGYLESKVERVPTVLDKALYAEATLIFNESQKIVPVDTGALRASGQVIAGKGEAIIGYGGPAASYALFVHEGGPKNWSRPGKSDKYLEIPFMAALPGFAERLAARMRGEFDGSTASGNDSEQTIS